MEVYLYVLMTASSTFVMALLVSDLPYIAFCASAGFISGYFALFLPEAITRL